MARQTTVSTQNKRLKQWSGLSIVCRHSERSEKNQKRKADRGIKRENQKENEKEKLEKEPEIETKSETTKLDTHVEFDQRAGALWSDCFLFFNLRLICHFNCGLVSPGFRWLLSDSFEFFAHKPSFVNLFHRLLSLVSFTSFRKCSSLLEKTCFLLELKASEGELLN